MSVDFTKLNKPGLGNSSFGVKRKNTGVSAQATKNLANSSAASKSSIFSNTRSPNFVAGHNAAKQSSRYSYQGARMRANTPFTPRNTRHLEHIPHRTLTTNQGNGIDNFTQNMQKATILMQTVQTGVSTITGIVNAFSSNSSQLDAATASLGGTAGVSTASSLGATSSRLIGATSFSEICNLESQVTQKEQSAASDYASAGQQIQQNISNTLSQASDGLQLAGVNIDTSSLQLSTLDMSNPDGAMATIDQDTSKIRNFYESTLSSAKTSISSKKCEISGRRQALEAQKGQPNAPADLDDQIKELKAQEDKLIAAEDAIDQAVKDCQSSIDTLNQKKADIRDVRQFKNLVSDKKYDLAKTKDKELGDLKKQAKKLEKDSKSNASNLQALQQQINTLTQELQSAGPIQNSKKQFYTFKNL